MRFRLLRREVPWSVPSGNQENDDQIPTQKRKAQTEAAEKKEQAKKRQGVLKQQSEIPAGSNARHRQRLLKQVPEAWPGEAPEDVAVFDDAVWETLPEKLAERGRRRSRSLQFACDSRGEDALKRTSAIPRSSPLSGWRLFIRGLVSWLDGETDAAQEAW